jgi:hypothetical protein
MTTLAPNTTVTRVLTAVLAVAIGVALTRAQSKEFYAKQTELRKQAAAEQQAAGLAGSANTKKLFAAHPTPEIAFAAPVVIAPGTTASLSFSGKFSDKTTFISGSESVVLSNVIVAPNSFKASATTTAGIGPQWARVYAFAPVSGAETWTPVFIGAPQAYTLTAKNGWTITLTPTAKQFTFAEFDAKVPYRAEFFKPGEQAFFEKTTGTLTLNASDSQASSYTFMMSSGNQGASMAEVLELTERMMALMKAGKTSGKEFAGLQTKLDAAQDRMTKDMEAQMADPKAFERKRDEFGCETINLFPKGAGLTGNINCGKNLGSLQVTGTLRQ